MKFKTEEGELPIEPASVVFYLASGYFTEVIEAANASTYGFACSVLTENLSRGLRVAHQLEAGSACVRHPHLLLLHTTVQFSTYIAGVLGQLRELFRDLHPFRGIQAIWNRD
jgi:acyl-CoA reductase-like NAD-dependent aldehyde dehydrogenase